MRSGTALRLSQFTCRNQIGAARLFRTINPHLNPQVGIATRDERREADAKRR